jgi:hypothetical protein
VTSLLDRLLERLPDVRRYGSRYAARCPVHHGAHVDSLSITEDHEKILLFCFGGCDTADIVKALGLDWSDLFRTPRVSTPRPKRSRRRAAEPTPEAPTFPHATASTLYAALYLGAILADELPSCNRDERLGCYLALCEDLGRCYVDHGHEAACALWHAWQPSLAHDAPALLAMIRRGIR